MAEPNVTSTFDFPLITPTGEVGASDFDGEWGYLLNNGEFSDGSESTDTDGLIAELDAILRGDSKNDLVDWLSAVEIRSDGSLVADAEVVNFGTDLSVTDDGSGQVTVDASASGSGNLTDADGIESRRQNVGAMIHGTFHDTTYTEGGYGVVFEAQDVTLDSVVVHSDISGISTPDLTIELRQWDSGANEPSIVDSVTHTLSGGVERLSLGFDVPATGAAGSDSNDEYMLNRGSNNGIPLRRRFEDDGHWSTADYTDHTYTDPAIDFLQGDNNSADFSGDEPIGSWYYFFDWLVGPTDSRVTSPYSTDIDELYVRPRDPEEETDVSPRSLWIDTS